MRLLTFMQIAEGKAEISFETIEQELQLDSDQVEAFIIDGQSFRSVPNIRIQCSWIIFAAYVPVVSAKLRRVEQLKPHGCGETHVIEITVL